MICISEGIHIIIIIFSDEKNTGNVMNYTLNLGMLKLASEMQFLQLNLVTFHR